MEASTVMIAPVLAATFTSADGFMLVATVLLLLVQLFLARAETGLTRMSKAKASGLADAHPKAGPKLVRLMEHPEGFINP